MSFLRKGLLATSSSILCVGLGVITTMMLARTLLPEGMGRYQLPINTVTLVVTLLSFGLGQSSIFFLNNRKVEVKQIMTNSVWVAIFTSVLLILTMPIVLSVFADYFGFMPMWVKLTLCLGMCGSYSAALFRPILIAHLRMREAVYMQVANSVFFLATVALCFLGRWLTVYLAICFFSVGSIIRALLGLWFLREHLTGAYSFDFGLFKDSFRYGLKLYSASILNIVNTLIGVMLLRYFMREDFTAVGYYGRATSLCRLAALLPMSLSPLLYAKWSGLSAEERRGQVEMVIRMFVIVGAIIIFGLAVFSHRLILFLYGESFLPAVPVLRILVIGLALRTVLSVCNQLLASDGRAQITAYLLGISVIVGVILTWALVPYYGINGAAIANVLASFTVFTIGLVIVKRLYNIRIGHMLFLKKSDFKYLLYAIKKRSVSQTSD